MNGRIAKKIVMLTFICMLTMFDVFVISKQIVHADEENQEKTQIAIGQTVEKYYEVAENEILLQQKVDLTLNKDDKTKTSESIEVNAPEIEGKVPNQAIVLLNGVKLPDNTYSYDAGKLEINLDKVDEINQFDNKQNSYQIIYTYSEIEIPEKISITLSTTAKANIDGEGEITEKNDQQIETSINGTDISAFGEITEEVYKGYLYQGTQFPTSYAVLNRIEISSLNNVENITINNVSEKFIEEDIALNTTTNEEEVVEFENDINQSLYYKLTKINKEEMLRILGNDGKVIIYNENGEALVEFNKDTEQDEQGNVVYEYNGEEIKNVRIVTTKPVQEGKLEIYHEKAIKANTGYTKEDIARFDYLRETVQVNNSTTVMNMKLIEPTTKYEVTLSKTEYSTMNTNADIDVSVILKNSQNNMNLYENPEIEIVFPAEVQSLEIQDQVNILYDSELSIRNYYVEGNIVHIFLNGVQTICKEVGTQINFKVSMTFDKKLTSRTSEIVTTVRNKNEQVENRKQVNIVSPREMITVNNVQGLGIESYGEQQQVVAPLEKNESEKTVQIESEVINNTGNATPVSILGELPTNSSENNLGATINAEVAVEGVDAKVYYSTNENATDDLNDDSNQWTEEVNNINDAKKYLIAIDEMGVDDVAQFSYNATVPADLEYNQQATQGYTVYYTDSELNITNRAESTAVVMSTGDGPVLEAQLVAKLNGEEINSGDTVKAGEKVLYEINITNTGTAEATDVSVNLNISESANEGANEPINIDAGVIQPDQTKTVKYEKEISASLSTEETMSASAVINYEDEVENTNEIALNVKTANIVGSIKWVTTVGGMDGEGEVPPEEEQEFSQGDIVEFLVTIKNNTDEVQDNLTLEWTLPENLEIVKQQIVSNTSFDPIEQLETNKVIELRELQPRETIRISLATYLGEFEEKQKMSYAAAVVRQEEEIYHLGKTEDKIVNNIDKFFELTLSSPNEGEYLKPGEEIDYILTIKNDNLKNVNVTITDTVSPKLTITDVIADVEEENIIIGGMNDITISNLNLGIGETKTITIKTIVDSREDDVEYEEISNQATLINGIVQIDSNVVTHFIDRHVDLPQADLFDVTLSSENEGAYVKAGESVDYVITVKNNNIMAVDVDIEDTIPAKLEITDVIADVTEDNIIIDDNDVTVSNLHLEAGETKTVTITTTVEDRPYDVIEYEEISNQATLICESEETIEKETNVVKHTIDRHVENGGEEEIPTEFEFTLSSENEGETLRAGDIIEYDIAVKNDNNVSASVNVTDTIPSQLTVTGVEADVENQNINIDGNNVTISNLNLDIGQTKVVTIRTVVNASEDNTGVEEIQNQAKLTCGTVEMESNVITHSIDRHVENEEVPNLFGLILRSSNGGETLKAGDEIEYLVEVRNINSVAVDVDITDEISSELSITDVIADVVDEKINIDGNNITISDLHLEVGETKTITIKAVVNDGESSSEIERITNQVKLTCETFEMDSNIITHYIDRSEEEPDNPDPGDPDDPDPEEPDNPDPEDPDNPDPEDPDDPDPEDPDNPSQTEGYRISGRVWLDTSLEGKRDDNESGIDGITVYLLNAQTNQLTNIIATTDTNGFYILDDVPNGQYIVVFDYSSTQYGLTKYRATGVEENRNSKAIAKSINIFGNEKTYGVTDTITVDGRSIGNISMGLIELDDFDLKIDKYINRVIVKTSNSTNVYSYNDTNLARIDLDAKTVDGSEVTVEYAIRVTNVGQVDGYVRRIVDDLPEGFTFDASQNKDWYGSGDTISSVIFANDKIAPGDSKTVYLTLTKSMTGEDTGTYTNSASIGESYNELNIQDRNVNGGNDESSAELLLSIRTGAAATYIVLIISIIGIIGIGVYFIKIKVLDVKFEERR